MNDFEEIQKIYSEGYRGQTFEPIRPSNYYPAKTDQGPYSRPVPGTPESSGYSAYNQNIVGNIAQIIDEEIPAAEIINLDVLEKIDELEQEANDAGMEYALLQLSRLREYIISLSQGRRN